MFKPTTAVLLLATLVTGTLVAQDTQKLLQLKREGEQAFNDQRFAVAATKFEQFVAELPESGIFKESRAHANYYVACAYARLAASAGDKKDDFAAYTTKAVGALSQSLAAGFDRFDIIERDPDLNAVRGSKQFKALIKKYEKLEQDKLQSFDFSLETLDGKPIAKKDFMGKVLVVDIWGTWCPPCRQEIPHFIALQKKYGKDGLQIVGLNQERVPSPQAKKATAKQFIKANGINYPCALVSPEVINSVPDFSGYPTTLFIGRDGRVRKKVVGYHPMAQLEAIVKPLLAEKVPVKSGRGKKS